ncbi:hypothetical protein V8C86DRAFT_3213608, partial [Haematococcus lacustris]
AAQVVALPAVALVAEELRRLHCAAEASPRGYLAGKGRRGGVRAGGVRQGGVRRGGSGSGGGAADAPTLDQGLGGGRGGGEGEGEGEGEEEGCEAGPEGGEEEPGPKAYRPEVQAVDQAVQQALGWALPPKAYFGSRAAVLLRLSTAQTQCQAWLSVCGADYTRSFFTKEPRLLSLPPAELLRSLEAVSNCLGLQPQQAVAWTLRNAALLAAGTLTQVRLTGLLAEVVSLLEVGPKDAVQLISRSTMLLTFEPGTLVSRLATLAALLPCPLHKLLAACTKRPALLTASPKALARKLLQLTALLSCNLTNTAAVLATKPGLAGLALPRLAARWQRLLHLAAFHPPWAQQLEGCGAPSLGRLMTVSDVAVERLQLVLRARLTHLAATEDLWLLTTMSPAAFNANVMVHAQHSRRPLFTPHPTRPPTHPWTQPRQGSHSRAGQDHGAAGRGGGGGPGPPTQPQAAPGQRAAEPEEQQPMAPHQPSTHSSPPQTDTGRPRDQPTLKRRRQQGPLLATPCSPDPPDPPPLPSPLP